MTSTLEHPAPEAPPTAVRGTLSIDAKGRGELRTDGGLMPSPGDVPVPAGLIRGLGLRQGDTVEGVSGATPALSRVERVNGRAPGEALRTRRRFHELTPVHPRHRLRLERPQGGLAPRLVDLIAPLGKGQRGLIVAPPKTGKTVLLQQLAASLAANHPACELLVLLLDERPEEVTDMRRSVRGEVLASTFDRPAAEHIGLADLAFERAKRLVEEGRDVVVLMDSLTRLCRAHNNAAASGGRTLSGGVDARALLGPKKLFGAARAAEEGGSLTVLATALVETGSRADDYFFEELKSTGNMELRLDAAPAGRRVYPAVHLTTSSTRREELLLDAGELAGVRTLRHALRSEGSHATLEALLDRLRRTPDNAAFLRQLGSA